MDLYKSQGTIEIHASSNKHKINKDLFDAINIGEDFIFYTSNIKTGKTCKIKLRKLNKKYINCIDCPLLIYNCKYIDCNCQALKVEY